MGPTLRLSALVRDPAAPGGIQLAIGTDVAVDSANLWSLWLSYIKVTAVYRGNSVAVVELTEGLTVEGQGSATFPVDLVPAFANPAASTVDYTADCLWPALDGSAVLPPTTTAAGSSGSARTWPLTLVVEVLPGWLGLPLITLTVPDIVVPCAAPLDGGPPSLAQLPVASSSGDCG